MTTVATRSNIRAAKYVRMSTEHQQYSTENQSDAIEKYALAHGMSVTETFIDSGKSGLTLGGRDALRNLLERVESGSSAFDVILVYDISRWGRFQDADESAYYEYVCKRAHVVVHYCAEQFENDGSFSSTLLKTIKRSMAGEYSRELSVKVFAGQCRLIELGYRQGGHAGYGLRRQLVDKDGGVKGVLAFGEQKSIQTDRVVLVLGPDDEVAVVHKIYDLFTIENKLEREISNFLNARGIQTDLMRPWTRATIHQMLTNPKYVGSNVYNRRSFKLKKKRVVNSADMWIRKDAAFPSLVEVAQFLHAQEIMEARHIHLLDEEMLERLRELLGRVGRLSGIIIDEAENMPPSAAFQRRFKSLHRAYSLIGYQPDRDYSYIEINSAIRIKHRHLCTEIIDQLRLEGASVSGDAESRSLLINGQYTVSLLIVRCREISVGSRRHRWHIRFDRSSTPDITIAARLKPGNAEILDFYLLPNLDQLSQQLSLLLENKISLDVYRFDDLSFFMSLGRQRALGEVR
jgi:DNA invertase Pin-like site-specific DNA recombinase